MYYSIRYIFAKGFKKIMFPATINHSEIDKTAKCDVGTYVSYSKMGKYSYIGENTSLSVVQVGAFTSISSGCIIGGGGHPMDWVSMSPMFHNSKGLMKKKFAKKEYSTHKTTYIGNDVWIGGNCLIKSGVHIADGAVIGMGSVVTHDVGPYEVWGGNPAHMIRKRFDEDTIQQFVSLQWWNWPDEKIKRYAELFDTPEKFFEKVNEGKD